MSGAQAPHPLAVRLAAALAERRGARALVVGAGDGRNVRPFHDAGVAVDAIEERAGFEGLDANYDGALSTHALLHGTRRQVAARATELARRLQPLGLLYATFGSTADSRFRAGDAVDDGEGWAPASGREAGIVHAYFDEAALRDALRAYEIVQLDERDVSSVVGRWAHDSADAPIVHWLVEARVRQPAAAGTSRTE